MCDAGGDAIDQNQLRHQCLEGKLARIRRNIQRLRCQILLEKRQLHQEQAQMLVYSSPDYFEPRRLHFCTNSYGLTTNRLNPTTGLFS